MWISKHATYLQCYVVLIPDAPAQTRSLHVHVFLCVVAKH